MRIRHYQKSIEEKTEIASSKLEEYFIKKTEQLEEFIDEKINQNAGSTLIIFCMKFNLRNEMSWNVTQNVLATTLSSVVTKTSSHMILKGHIAEITKMRIPRCTWSVYSGKLHQAY